MLASLLLTAVLAASPAPALSTPALDVDTAPTAAPCAETDAAELSVVLADTAPTELAGLAGPIAPESCSEEGAIRIVPTSTCCISFGQARSVQECINGQWVPQGLVCVYSFLCDGPA